MTASKVEFGASGRDSAPWENGSGVRDYGPPVPETPGSIVARWKNEGAVKRVATGFPTLDAACRGGFPIPWRVLTIGAPSAGKTAFDVVVARRFVDAGLAVGVLGVDEEPDDLNVRLAQMAGFTVEECESREREVLEKMATDLSDLDVRFYSFEHTIEASAADLAAWAKTLRKPAALIIDSIQTARCAALLVAEREPGPREMVEANIRAVRAVSTDHRLLVLATVEANRGSYRNEAAAEESNDMAAGKESSAIEYGGQTVLMLRTPKGYPNHVSVSVPKNRRGARAGFKFFLRLDRERHELAECPDPTEGDAAHEAQVAQEKKGKATRAEVERDAQVLAGIVRATPGLGSRELRGALRKAGQGWGPDRLTAARLLLEGQGLEGHRLVNQGSKTRAAWAMKPVGSERESEP